VRQKEREREVDASNSNRVVGNNITLSSHILKVYKVFNKNTEAVLPWF
jgi:hypothetical protein